MDVQTRISVWIIPALVGLAAGRASGQCVGLAGSQAYPGPLPETMRQMAVGDFNGDGALDVVEISRLCKVRAMLNNGNGVFTAQPLVSTTGPGGLAAAAAAGDFDGDGKLDLAIGQAGQALYVLGDGNGGFGAQTTAVPGSITAAILEAADMDGDGWVDLVSADPAGTPMVAFNDHGQFGPFQPVGAVGAAPLALTVGDADGDGRPDIACLSGAAVTIVRNLGERQFHTDDPLPIAVAAPASIQMGNLTGHGGGDVVVVGAAAQPSATVNIYHRTPGGTLAFSSSVALSTASRAFLVDFDADGDTDILVPAWSGTSAAYLLTNFGNGTFLNTSSGIPVEAGPSTIGLSGTGDFTGDGLPDLVVDLPATPTGVRIFANTSRVTLAEQPHDVVLPNGADTAVFHAAPPAGDSGASVRWQVRRSPDQPWQDLSEGPVDGLGDIAGSAQWSLQVSGVPTSASGAEFRARVVTSCRPFATVVARLTVEGPDCPADFNGDGFIDFFDYDDFIGAFEAGC